MTDDLLSDTPGTPPGDPATPPPAPPPPGEPTAPREPEKGPLPANDMGSDPNKEFLKTLPKDLQDNPSLGRYSSTEGLARAYLNAERMIGTEKVPIPKDDADQEAWDRFYTAAGRPAQPDGYTFEKPQTLPEGVTYDTDLENWWRQQAHHAGLGTRQAKDVVGGFMARVQAQVELNNRQIDQSVVRGKAELQRDWGSEYEARRALARAAFMEMPADLQKLAKDSGMARYPSYIKWLYDTRVKLTGERQPHPPGESAESSAEALLDKITAFRTQHQAPLYDKHHPEHDLRSRELTEMYKRLYPAVDTAA